MAKIKLDVSCDFVVSKFCRVNYTINKYAYAENLLKNANKFRCKFCAIEQTHGSDKSHYFRYIKNNDYFSIIDSDMKAYLLGILAGDGSIMSRRINLVANTKDIETINKFVKEIYCHDVPILSHNGNCFAVNVSSEKLVSDVCRHLNILPGKKSDKITLPKLNGDLLWAFVRGLFDTDGCVANIKAKQSSPSCFYSSTSNTILHQIQKICLEEHIVSNITGIKLKFNGVHALNFMRKIYNNSDNHLSRKFEMFKLWETWSPRKGHMFQKFDTISKRRALSEDDVKFILVNQLSFNRKELANKFNVSLTTISEIINRKTYREIRV